jgi:hypothetical protein
MSQPDTSVRDSWSELKVLSRASQVRTAQGPFFPLIPGLWRPATFWKPLIGDREKGWQVDPISGKHDRVAAADGPAVDNRGVNADVHGVVLSSRPEDS